MGVAVSQYLHASKLEAGVRCRVFCDGISTSAVVGYGPQHGRENDLLEDRGGDAEHVCQFAHKRRITSLKAGVYGFLESGG
jgi:hypothetical protein